MIDAVSSSCRQVRADDTCGIRSRLTQAELRNGIYELATECFDGRTFAPRIQKTFVKPKSWAERYWKFFGLTQSCKQIRAEYRPLWFRKLEIMSPPVWLSQFVETFLSSAEELQHAPNLVQIEWERDIHDYVNAKCNITALLRLRAHRPTFQFKFVPGRLADGTTQDEELCWYCIHEMEIAELGHLDSDNMYERCTCAPPGLDTDDWESFQYEVIGRTWFIENFIRNDNATWLSDMREGRMSVQCLFGKVADPITFRILCKDRFAQFAGSSDDDHAEGAWNLITDWGIAALDSQENMAFVVAFEAERKMNKGGYELVSSELREVRLALAK
jgi:hypothetical protein